jgi:flagellar motor switch protein FliG
MIPSLPNKAGTGYIVPGGRSMAAKKNAGKLSRFISEIDVQYRVLLQVMARQNERFLHTAEAALGDIKGGGVRAGADGIAVILGLTDEGIARDVLHSIQKSDPVLAEEISRRLTGFEEIRQCDNASIQRILGKTDPATLATALKGTAADIKTRILKNMSRKAAAALVERIESMGAVRMQNVRQARVEIATVMHNMEKKGLVCIERADEDVLID